MPGSVNPWRLANFYVPKQLSAFMATSIGMPLESSPWLASTPPSGSHPAGYDSCLACQPLDRVAPTFCLPTPSPPSGLITYRRFRLLCFWGEKGRNRVRKCREVLKKSGQAPHSWRADLVSLRYHTPNVDLISDSVSPLPSPRRHGEDTAEGNQATLRTDSKIHQEF